MRADTNRPANVNDDRSNKSNIRQDKDNDAIYGLIDFCRTTDGKFIRTSRILEIRSGFESFCGMIKDGSAFRWYTFPIGELKKLVKRKRGLNDRS